MSFRTRLLVCGYEPEQIEGRTGYEEERWWVHVAAFSAQGAYSLPWWPVPADTVKGDLFLVRLAAFEVPGELRAELSKRRIEIGEGLAGRLAEEAISYMGFPLFGGGMGDSYFDLPRHPEFDPDRQTLGGGLIGLAVAHSAATPMPEIPGLYEALVGTLVPFPDILAPKTLQGRFGPALDDLSTPMRERSRHMIDLRPAEFERFLEMLFERFAGDDWFRDSVLRLKEVAARLGQPMSYFPSGLSPTPRWSFDSSISPIWPEAPDFPIDSSVGPIDTRELGGSENEGSPQAAGQPRGNVGQDLIDSTGRFAPMLQELVDQFLSWADQDRLESDRPLSLECLVTDDGSGRRYFELPLREAEESSVTNRIRAVLGVQEQFLPNPSAALLVHDRMVYLVGLYYFKEAGEPQTEIAGCPLPEPGSIPEIKDFRNFDIGEEETDRPAGGPYGEEALEIRAHLLNDLLGNLRRWAEGERSPSALPPEGVMYDGGVVWHHDSLPPTKIKRPSLSDRFKELVPILLEMAPSPTAITFLHRKKLYVLIGASAAPEEVIVRLLRLEVPPPGQSFSEPFEMDMEKLGLGESTG